MLKNSPKGNQNERNQMKTEDIENKDIENCASAYFLNFPQFSVSLLPYALNILRGNHKSWVWDEKLNILRNIQMPAIRDASEASIRLKINTQAYTEALKLPDFPDNKALLYTIDDEFSCLIGIQKFFKTRDSSKVQ